MHSNYKLKLAVLTALSISAIGLPHSALALGLGNIEVKSHLGQPLRAAIKIHGASDLKGDACFKAVNDGSFENALSNLNFKLSKIVNDEATLTVTSNQIINEPITNLSVLTECETNIRRDYVLLLDPPLTAEAEDTVDEESTIVADNSQAKVKPTKAFAAQQQTIKAASTVKKSAKAKRQKDNKNIVLSAGYDLAKADEANAIEAKGAANTAMPAKTKQPHLSISGGDSAGNMPNMADLQTNLLLDKQLHFAPDAPAEGIAGDIAVQDEVTVMNNRLAHLQAQIGALAQANKKLSMENQLQSEQLKEVNSTKNKLNWLGYVLAGGLLLSGITIADKFRRRRLSRQLADPDLAWVSAPKSGDALSASNDADDIFASDTLQHFEVIDEGTVAKTNEAQEVKAEIPPFSVEEFNADVNVLDHADVFLSHGRTSLAIQLLQNHLLENPKQSVTIWLFLLDLLAKENMHAAYEQTALECKEHYNIRIPAFSNDEASPKQRFEDFPRLTAGLEQVWGTPAAVVYLDDLIYNSRLENRVGFEKSVLEELILLKNVAHEAINSAEVIQLDEKKLAMKEMKEAQIAAKKEEKLKQMDELIFKQAEQQAIEEKLTPFEFNLVEFK